LPPLIKVYSEPSRTEVEALNSIDDIFYHIAGIKAKPSRPFHGAIKEGFFAMFFLPDKEGDSSFAVIVRER
jgi:hypothetical protein